MYKIFSSLFAFFILFMGTLSASSLYSPKDFDLNDSNYFNITFKTFKPSRVYEVNSSDPSAQKINKMDYGFGASVNFLNFEYSSMFTKGERYTLYYSFAHKSPVNPYIGFSYINKTKLYDKPSKRKIDGFDALVGMEVSYLRYIVPYFEYTPSASVWFFGVKFKLGMVFDKSNLIKVDVDAQKQNSKPEDSNKNNSSIQNSKNTAQASTTTKQTDSSKINATKNTPNSVENEKTGRNSSSK